MEKVKCKMTKVKCSQKMNDRDYLNDLLESVKDLTKNMTVSLTEASNESLFKEFDSYLKKIKDCQRTLFELAWSKGWYTLETAQDNKISEKKQELQTLYDELNK